MPHRLRTFVDQHLGPGFVPRLKQQALGLAEDFWKDGPENLFGLDFTAGNNADDMRAIRMARDADVAAADTAARPQPTDRYGAPLWHAEPGEISEKMWGEGFVAPGANTVNAMLIKPLGLSKAMSVLDLSAGLGGRMRYTAAETGAYITGLEPDAAIAMRGMQMSAKAGKSKRAPIAHYDPAKLMLNRMYDCILARETFYRAANRDAFFKSIAQHAKPHAQIAFTDYILDPEHRDHPVIAAWKNHEKLADPLGLVEMAEAWSKVGFGLRVHEDLTDFYKAQVLVGMRRLMTFLASGVHPDKETAASVLRRIETWKHRMAAMDAGLKFYRFYGIRN